MVLLQSIAEDFGNLDTGSHSFAELMDLCFACRRCIEVCPAGIQIPDLIIQARHAISQHHKINRLGKSIFNNYGLFDRIGSYASPLSNWMLRRLPVRYVMEKATGIHRDAFLPTFTRRTFWDWFQTRQPRRISDERMLYFPDSYAIYNRPELGIASVELLEEMGYSVIVPKLDDSGMPSLEFGELDTARKIAQRNLSELSRWDLKIACSSLGASHQLKHGYPELLDSREARKVAGSTVDLIELVDEHVSAGLVSLENGERGEATYHYCCLARALGLRETTVGLLEKCGYKTQVVDQCCGGAGVWGLFRRNFDVSGEIAGKLGRTLSDGRLVFTESETCALQIAGRLSIEPKFPIETIRECLAPTA
jgi:Fe-S oxidoreductase